MMEFKEFTEHKDRNSGEIWVVFDKPNRRGENIRLQFGGDRENRLYLRTYVLDPEGGCSGGCNPTMAVHTEKDSRGNIVHIRGAADMIISFTEENVRRLINEVAKLFYEEA